MARFDHVQLEREDPGNEVEREPRASGPREPWKIPAGLFKARLSYKPRVSEDFDFSFVTFWLGNLFILVALQFWAGAISNYTKR